VTLREIKYILRGVVLQISRSARFINSMSKS